MTLKNLVVYSIIITLSVLFGLLLNFLENDNYGLSYLLVFSLLILCSVPFIISIKQKKFDLWSLIIIVSSLYFLYFGVRMIFVIFYNSQFLDIRENLHYFNTALIYSIIGFIMMLLGYYLVAPRIIKNRKLPKLPEKWDKKKTLIVISLLYGIGLFFRFVLIIRGESIHLAQKESLYAGTLFQLSSLSQYALILTIISFFYFTERRRLFASLLFIMVPIEILYAITSFSKLYITQVFLIPIVLYHYLKKAVPIRFYVLFLIFFVSLHPILSIFISKMSLTADLSIPIKEISTELQDFFVDLSPHKIVESFMYRYHGIDSMAAIIRYTPQVMDYMRGESLILIAESVVPRLLWLDKPQITFGDIFGEKYLGMKLTSSYIITFPGEMYLNFGVIGIIIGMTLLGIFYKIFYFYLIEYNKRNISGVFVYTTSFFYLVFIENTITYVFSALIKVLAISLFILLVITQRNKR